MRWILLLGVLLIAKDNDAHATPPRLSLKPQTPTVAILSPEARQVAAHVDGLIRIWDRQTGKRLVSIPSRTPFRGVLADQTLLAVSDRGLAVWQGARFQRFRLLMAAPRGHTIGGTAISTNGRTAAAFYPRRDDASDPDAMSLWDVTSGRLLGQVALDKGRVLGVVFSPSGRRLALFGDEHRQAALLQIYTATGSGLKKPLLHWKSPAERTTYCAAFTPDEQRLLLCAGSKLLLFHLPSKKLLTTQAVAAAQGEPFAAARARTGYFGAHGLAFAPQGGRFATLHAIGRVGVALWEMQPRGRHAVQAGGAKPALSPLAWINRPETAGVMRQMAWDKTGQLWLVSAGYLPQVELFQRHGARFVKRATLK